MLVAAFSIGCLLDLTGCSGPLREARLRVGHRLYPAFNEIHSVRPGETFPIGDTAFTGRIVDVLPDFAIDDSTKRVFSRSNEPRNPALRIRIFEHGKTVEDVWAFPGDGPPHFAASSKLYFRVDSLGWREDRGASRTEEAR
jgi:hypothetical protein